MRRAASLDAAHPSGHGTHPAKAARLSGRGTHPAKTEWPNNEHPQCGRPKIGFAQSEAHGRVSNREESQSKSLDRRTDAHPMRAHPPPFGRPPTSTPFPDQHDRR